MTFELGNDLEIQAIWLYYGDGRTQAETAAILGVSRTSAANLLASARQKGLVTINLAPDLLSRVRTSRKLKKKFGLQSVHVVPIHPQDNPPEIRQKLARAAANLLNNRFAEETVVGVASGRTMAALGEEIPRHYHSNLQVIQVSGSSLGDAATSPEACTMQIASRLGAHGFNFLAPAVVTSPTLKDALLKEPTLQRHFERIRSCALVIFSIGELTANTTLAESDELTQAVLPEYLSSGAIAVIIGRFINHEGREVNGPLSGRQLAPELIDLLAIPERICVAGGAEKTEAIRAAIAGGYITHLIIDTISAAKLLESGS